MQLKLHCWHVSDLLVSTSVCIYLLSNQFPAGDGLYRYQHGFPQFLYQSCGTVLREPEVQKLLPGKAERENFLVVLKDKLEQRKISIWGLGIFWNDFAFHPVLPVLLVPETIKKHLLHRRKDYGRALEGILPWARPGSHQFSVQSEIQLLLRTRHLGWPGEKVGKSNRSNSKKKTVKSIPAQS